MGGGGGKLAFRRRSNDQQPIRRPSVRLLCCWCSSSSSPSSSALSQIFTPSIHYTNKHTHLFNFTYNLAHNCQKKWFGQDIIHILCKLLFLVYVCQLSSGHHFGNQSPPNIFSAKDDRTENTFWAEMLKARLWFSGPLFFVDQGREPAVPFYLLIPKCLVVAMPVYNSRNYLTNKHSASRLPKSFLIAKFFRSLIITVVPKFFEVIGPHSLFGHLSDGFQHLW